MVLECVVFGSICYEKTDYRRPKKLQYYYE